MPSSVHTIPRNRTRWIPRDLRLAHEYCFFLHDECVRLLAEYEAARAHIVTVKFRSKVENKVFSKIPKTSPIEAMRATGYPDEARRVILNTVTMAMVSDCLHHIYETLRCMEKRKVIVAHNLLRKPLTDNLMYLSWMLGDEDAFYAAFTAEGGDAVISREVASRRPAIIAQALATLPIANVLTATFVHRTIFDRTNPSGLYGLFQQAVHLVTAKHAELRTEPENFNFIFKNYADDDIYELLYDVLPHLMLYLSHVIVGLFDRMRPMDDWARRAFEVRSILGMYLVEAGESEAYAIAQLANVRRFHCGECRHPFSLTPHNAARVVLSESYRCTRCRRVRPFPCSWLFYVARARGGNRATDVTLHLGGTGDDRREQRGRLKRLGQTGDWVMKFAELEGQNGEPPRSISFVGIEFKPLDYRQLADARLNQPVTVPLDWHSARLVETDVPGVDLDGIAKGNATLESIFSSTTVSLQRVTSPLFFSPF